MSTKIESTMHLISRGMESKESKLASVSLAAFLVGFNSISEVPSPRPDAERFIFLKR